MKKTFLILTLVITNLIFSQSKTDFDPRIVENKGEQVTHIYQNQQDYYQFLLFELDNGYQVVSKNTLAKEQRKELKSIKGIQSKSGEKFTVNQLENPATFNFMKYNFIREKDNHTYYDLNNGNVLVIFSQMHIKREFLKTGLQNAK